MKCRYFSLYSFFFSLLSFFSQAQLANSPFAGVDTAFWQDYHEAYPLKGKSQTNEIRSIGIDAGSNIWVATPEGVFRKKPETKDWESIIEGDNKGPAYKILTDQAGVVWMGTWNGIYSYKEGVVKKEQGTEGPVSALCLTKNGLYAFGPKGVWMLGHNGFARKDYAIARTVRHAIADRENGIWVTSDVGLYHLKDNRVVHFYDTGSLVSAYVKGVAIDNSNQLWVGGLGGVSILQNDKKVKALRRAEGLPSIYVNCVQRSPEGDMWVGTDVGVVRYTQDGSRQLRFSRRWLLDDKVNDIAFDRDGNAWVGTAKGVSAIMRRKMTLAQKADYFYDITMKRHIREPWISGPVRLRAPGDPDTWEPEDDDNDGEYTGNYLAMESFRYAATGSKDAKEKAKKGFEFLQLLQTVTGLDGFFARTIVPVSWGDNVHDPNRAYTERQLAEELVKEPRFKPVETRWRRSKDGKWFWKGDTSSDEWCGHMFGYYFYYELVADKKEKKVIAAHVAGLVDHLIRNNFNMVDIDGTPTRWSVWSPDRLNRDPEWLPDRYQNSMELLGFLKLAYHMTGDMKYQTHYLRLINEEHYLENMAKIKNQNPAFFIYFDVILQSYIYPILTGCEKDLRLKGFYEAQFDEWMERRKGDQNPLINFLYCYTREKRVELNASVESLKNTPLDLIGWRFDHRKREDVRLVHEPVLDEVQIDQLPSPDIRTAIRWDKNPWDAVSGDASMEREPVFWLLPYWMGKYLKMIE